VKGESNGRIYQQPGRQRGCHENFIGRLSGLMYLQMKIAPDQVAVAHKTIAETWANTRMIPTSDPAISDVMSDDVMREINPFLQGVEKDFRAMLR
jgi:hypothetical protein